jgi:uncharacterized protein YecT (DUF1311 family)
MSHRAAAASFECAKAIAPSDKAICANPALSAKDDELGRLYRQRESELQSQGGDVKAFVANGRRWLAMRTACTGNAQCLNMWFDERIAALTPSALVTNPAPSSSSPAFKQGQIDRQNWESWFASVTGDYHAGAEYWATHRSDQHPPSCGASPPSTSADWTAGCYAAQQKLAEADLRRKTELDYRRGWNALPLPTRNAATKPTANSPLADSKPLAPPAKSELLVFGPKAGMEVTVVSKGGIGTSYALIRGVLTAANSKSYCVGYELDNSQSCVDRFLRETHLSDNIEANCNTGTFSTFYGEHLQFIGKNSNPDDPDTMAAYVVRNEETGQILSGFAASGLDYDMEQFNALCPGRSDTAPVVDVSTLKANAISATDQNPLKTPVGIPIEKNAVLFSSSPEALHDIDILVGMVTANGYRCDSVSSFRPYAFSRGFTLRCNSFDYTYDFADKGRGYQFQPPD